MEAVPADICHSSSHSGTTLLLKNMTRASTTVLTDSKTTPELKPLVVTNGVRNRGETKEDTEENSETVTQEVKYKRQYVWRNIAIFLYVHIAGVYGLYSVLSQAYWHVFFYQLSYGFLGGIGITAGAHRLWAHKSYKAKWPMRLLLAIFQTIAFQNHIYEWSRDHRVHHKFSETDADPHNAKRGFFFSHIGWLLLRKHPDVRQKGKTVDMSDLERDPIVMWQKRYYLVLMPLLTFIIPTWIPWYFWGIDGWVSWYATLFRWGMSLNCTWLVNSAAHMWGNKPYDRNINPAENIVVAALAYGEGWHNYHHTFPYDYKAAELGDYAFNPTTGFIDFFARIGWAYDLKTVSETVIRKRIERTGDGTHPKYGNEHEEEHSQDMLWGWGDKDMESDDVNNVEILNGISK